MAECRAEAGRSARMGWVSDVYLEVGKRKVFACARDWPGWCRAGRGEEAALTSLAAVAPRFAAACAVAGVPFDAAMAARFDVVARVPGTATTDFGALDVPASSDHEPVSDAD